MNRRHVGRGLTAVLAAGSAAFGFLPLAAAATSVVLTPTVEAWYQTNPSCQSPTGCVTTSVLPVPPPIPVPTAPSASPYPAGTLHVGVAGGKENARSYLRFPLEQFAGKQVTGGTLTIPLDTNPRDGSVSPETSKIAVCETSASDFPAAQGSVAAPPTSDCGASVDLKYVAKPTPHLEAALGPLAVDLPNITGLVLLPDATKNAPSAAWQVVFSAHNRAGATKTPPAALAVTFEEPAAAVGAPPPAVGAPSTGGVATTPDLGSGSGIAAAPGTGLAAPPPVQVPQTAPEVATVQAPAVAPAAAPPQFTSPQFITVGYAYPIVWLLPLGFLILVPLAAKALTKDLGTA